MKTKALLFVIFTICLFALGVFITTIFNTAPTTVDAIAMFYASLSLTIFGLIFFLLIGLSWAKSQIKPGLSTLKGLMLTSIIIDAFVVAVLALKANNVLSWPTAAVLMVVAIVLVLVLKRQKNR